MSTLPSRVDRLICSMPRSGGNMFVSMLNQAGGGTAGEWPHDLPENATIALVHLHYVAQVAHVPHRAVYLYRRNLLAQAVSWAAAYVTEDWKVGEPTGPVNLDPGLVVSLAGELRSAERHWLDWLAERSIQTLHVAYEDLTDARRAGRAVKFLGGDPARIDPSTRRQATWVNDLHVDGIRLDLERLLATSETPLDDRLRHLRMSRAYLSTGGGRRDTGCP